MFRCERCGSRYSTRHAATIGNCPRCEVREQVSTPLYFKPFRLPDSYRAKSPERGARDGEADSAATELSV